MAQLRESKKLETDEPQLATQASRPPSHRILPAGVTALDQTHGWKSYPLPSSSPASHHCSQFCRWLISVPNYQDHVFFRAVTVPYSDFTQIPACRDHDQGQTFPSAGGFLSSSRVCQGLRWDSTNVSILYLAQDMVQLPCGAQAVTSVVCPCSDGRIWLRLLVLQEGGSSHLNYFYCEDSS